jgi:hypothetical protein
VKEFHRRHLVWSWALIALVGLMLTGGCGESSGSDSQPDTAADAGSAPDSASPRQRVRDALEDAKGPVEDPRVTRVEFGRKELTVTAKTPEGGFQGASTKDLDRQAGAIFAAIYGDAGWRKTGAVVVFKGGLVNSKTGEDLPDVNTGIYTIKRGEARQIDWSDDDAINYTIDWSLYRDFAHPALKQ